MHKEASKSFVKFTILQLVPHSLNSLINSSILSFKDTSASIPETFDLYLIQISLKKSVSTSFTDVMFPEKYVSIFLNVSESSSPFFLI